MKKSKALKKARKLTRQLKVMIQQLSAKINRGSDLLKGEDKMTNNYRTVSVTFDGHAGDKLDNAVIEILDQADAEYLSGGTYLGTPMRRDMQFSVHTDRVRHITKALGAIGVNVSIE